MITKEQCVAGTEVWAISARLRKRWGHTHLYGRAATEVVFEKFVVEKAYGPTRVRVAADSRFAVGGIFHCEDLYRTKHEALQAALGDLEKRLPAHQEALSTLEEDIKALREALKP
jgi:hypothetical protein